MGKFRAQEYNSVMT
ncbi:hypothetical protein [Haemophilus paraphrohaemolyticus]|nr:hypothetical protein [Haemophilus paraphrohaemolyticus]